MAELSKKGFITLFINGITYNAPLEWQDLNVLATFDNESTQANISTTEITLVGEAMQSVKDIIDEGLTGGVGIFEGVPAKIAVYNKNNTAIVFDGYINLTKDYKDESWNGRIFVTVQKKDGLNSLEDRLSGLTYGYLEEQKVFTLKDYISLEYVVEKNNNSFEILVNSVTLFLMLKELAEAVKTTAETISDTVAFFATGATGGIAASIYAVSKSVITVAYTATLTVAVTGLINDLVQTFVSPLRKHKVISLYTLLANVSEHLGYTLETDIAELKEFFFLPSNNNLDQYDKQGFIFKTEGTKTGLPNITDNGYLCSEMFGAVKNMFRAKLSIEGSTLQFKNVDSSYWVKKSIYKMPPVLEKTKQYNTDELNANRLLSFATDISDEWTTSLYTGTTIETITDAVTVNNADAKYISGLDNVQIPYALGNRKTELNALENAVAKIGGAADRLIKSFGGGSSFKAAVQNRVGSLKVSNNNTTTPKILYLKNGKMPSNHRSICGAPYLSDKFHAGKSFVQNDYYGQKVVYEGVRIPFGFEDYLLTIENSYFTTEEGAEAKITKLEYNINSDTAIVDYWIRQKYTVNLKETIIIP